MRSAASTGTPTIAGSYWSRWRKRWPAMTWKAASGSPGSCSNATMCSGILGSIAIWAANLQVCYMLVPWACAHHDISVIFLSNASAMVLTIACGLLSPRDWLRAGRKSASSAEGSVMARGQFLGLLGLLVSGSVVLLVLLQTIAAMFIDPCTL